MLEAPPASPPVPLRPAAPARASRRAVVVIPAYNEAEGIERTLRAAHAATERVDGFEVRLLVVDSSSPDGTARVVQGLLSELPRLHLVVEPRRSGLGGAYLFGMRFAVDALGAEALVEFDADLSHDPLRIPALLGELARGAGFAVGTRYSGGGSIPQDWAPHRRLLSVLGNRAIRMALGHPQVTDWTGGFRALESRFFLACEPGLRAYTGYTFQAAFLHQALRAGARVREVPYAFVDRTAGRSKLGPSYVGEMLVYLGRELWAGRAPRMLGVGALGFLVQALALRALVEGARLAPAPANLLAAQLAIASNFLLNDRWTFADRRGGARHGLAGRYLRFVSASVAGVAVVQTGAVWLGVRLFGPRGYLAYLLVGTALLFLLNLLFASRVVWPGSPDEGSLDEQAPGERGRERQEAQPEPAQDGERREPRAARGEG